MKKTWCSQCRAYMVVCQHCGNNTCNGGYGCDKCKEAYEFDKNTKLTLLQEIREVWEFWKYTNCGENIIIRLKQLLVLLLDISHRRKKDASK